MTIVKIRHGRLSSRIAATAQVTAVVRVAVAPDGRERDLAADEWVIYGSRVSVLLDALRERGFEVAEVLQQAGGAT